MTEPKPFSDEEIANFQQLVDQVEKDMPPMLLIKPGYIEAHENYRHFLDTIAEYKKALDSAMTQVSSLNQGNIADRKRIEELEKYIAESEGCEECGCTSLSFDRSIITDEDGNELQGMGYNCNNCGKRQEETVLDRQEKLADQAATIERLEKLLEEEGYRFPEKEAHQALDGKEE